MSFKAQCELVSKTLSCLFTGRVTVKRIKFTYRDYVSIVDETLCCVVLVIAALMPSAHQSYLLHVDFDIHCEWALPRAMKSHAWVRGPIYTCSYELCIHLFSGVNGPTQIKEGVYLTHENVCPFPPSSGVALVCLCCNTLVMGTREPEMEDQEEKDAFLGAVLDGDAQRISTLLERESPSSSAYINMILIDGSQSALMWAARKGFAIHRAVAGREGTSKCELTGLAVRPHRSVHSLLEGA